ncbi:MAG: DinB family protein [Flavisolibacter sp.]
MFKRTKSYLLLTFLVLTGFAGRIHSDSLPGKERKILVSDLKDTKKDFLQSLRGLSEAQLNFKSSPESWSIKECAYHIALSEGNLWKWAEDALKQKPNPEKRTEIKLADADFMQKIRSRENKVKTFASYEPVNASYKTLDEAMDDFKTRRADLIRFAKTSTGNMRDHVVEGMMGMMDTYQMILVLSGHTARHTAQIEEIKQHPSFPK